MPFVIEYAYGVVFYLGCALNYTCLLFDNILRSRAIRTLWAFDLLIIV
jgi:hypothetical protein